MSQGEEYVKVKELGKGTFGVVSLVKNKSGNFYACISEMSYYVLWLNSFKRI